MAVAYAVDWAPLPTVTDWSAPLVKAGTSFTAVTAMVKVCAALVSDPPLAMPPLSCRATVTVAVPFALAAVVYVNVPLAAIAGCVANSALLLLVTVKLSAWPISSAGPALIDVAHAATVWAPASSSTVWFAPAAKLGESLTETIVTLIVAVLL